MKAVKRLIALSILVAIGFSSVAEARVLGAMPNKNGGRIELLTDACGDMEGWFSARSTSDVGVTVGCWTLADTDQDTVVVEWTFSRTKMVPHLYGRQAFDYSGH